MSTTLPVPPASACREEHANWLELQAFRDSGGIFSLQNLINALRIAGSSDALEEVESEEIQEGSDSDRIQSIAEDAFGEVEERFRACGAEQGSYPFNIEEQLIRLKPKPERSIYTFLLLLSYFGEKEGLNKIKATKLFEDICAKAAESYLGGKNDYVHSIVFGFPRRIKPKGFRKALDRVCQEMGEGACHRERPITKDNKDAGLDVVAWRDFTDQRQGKLIAFGQCATGRNWKEKETELQPDDFCRLWVQDPLTVKPIKMFFVPHRVESIQWTATCMQAGILFDRCRIASLAVKTMNKDLIRQCAQWSKYVIKEELKL